MSEIELKLCPFCGAEPEVGFAYETGRGDVYEVDCSSCIISIYGPLGFAGEEAKQAAIAAWNQRTPEPAPRLDAAVIERARIEAWAQATAWHRHGIAWKHLEKTSQDDLIEAARMSLDVINFREGG